MNMGNAGGRKKRDLMEAVASRIFSVASVCPERFVCQAAKDSGNMENGYFCAFLAFIHSAPNGKNIRIVALL